MNYRDSLFALLVLLRHTDNPACETSAFEQAADLFDEGDLETAVIDQQMDEWPDLDDDEEIDPNNDI